MVKLVGVVVVVGSVVVVSVVNFWVMDVVVVSVLVTGLLGAAGNRNLLRRVVQLAQWVAVEAERVAGLNDLLVLLLLLLNCLNWLVDDLLACWVAVVVGLVVANHGWLHGVAGEGVHAVGSRRGAVGARLRANDLAADWHWVGDHLLLLVLRLVSSNWRHLDWGGRLAYRVAVDARLVVALGWLLTDFLRARDLLLLLLLGVARAESLGGVKVGHSGAVGGRESVVGVVVGVDVGNVMVLDRLWAGNWR